MPATRSLLRLSALIGLLLLGGMVAAESTPVESTWTIPGKSRDVYASVTQPLVHTDAAGNSMPYRLFVPPNYDPKKQYPVILSLHGAGSRGEDNLEHLREWTAAWTDDSVQSKYPSFIIMPQTRKSKELGTWSGTTWKTVTYNMDEVPESGSLRLAREILADVIARHSIDTKRVYVMGASMGGCGTWAFCMRYPDIVAAAIPVCGNSDVTKASILKDIPIWTFHGDQDTTVPFDASVQMVDAIKAAGGTKIRFTVYPGVSHSSFRLFWREGAVVDWLFAQNLDQRSSK